MKSIPPIKAVMTPFPYWVGPRDPLSLAAALMAEHGVHHLPVMDGKRPIGLLRAAQVERARVTSGDDCAVCDVGPGEAPYVVGLTDPLDRVLLHMAERGVDAALVLKDGKLAGIFTTSDACHQFGKLLRTLFPSGGDDAA